MSRENAAHAPGNEISKGDGGMRQHKTMAEGGKISGERNDFGVGATPGTRSIPMGGHDSGKVLPDHERGCGPAIPRGGNEMHATADSDHGEHGHNHKIHSEHLPKGKRPHHVGG